MREHTENEFASNIRRTKNFVAVYDTLTEASKGGRRSVHKTDVLRAAVVFLHGSLEELFRNLLKWKLPDADEATLNEIPVLGAQFPGRPEKFLLGKLAGHRQSNVENFIRLCIDDYVDYMGINNISDLAGCLKKVGLDPERYRARLSELDVFLKRRHQIVHQTDRNHEAGMGQHRAQSLSRRQVDRWIKQVEQFSAVVLADMTD